MSSSEVPFETAVMPDWTRRTANEIDRIEISEWLTLELNARPGCAETKVTVKYQLVETDAEGCN